MKTEKQFNEEKEIIREGLATLLKQNFEGLNHYQTFLDNKMKEKITYFGKDATEDFDVSHVKRDSYTILGIIKRTGYFTDMELKKLTRKYSNLDERITIAECNIRKFKNRSTI